MAVVQAVFRGFGVLPAFPNKNVVVASKVCDDTDYLVFPTLNISQKVTVKGFPRCKVVGLAEFAEKIIPPPPAKHHCKYVVGFLNQDEIDVLIEADEYAVAGIVDADLEYQFGLVMAKIVEEYKTSATPCKHLQTLYDNVVSIKHEMMRCDHQVWM